jgi:hypothetical protein
MSNTSIADRTTYAPFILADRGERHSLLLTDDHMAAKEHIFRNCPGWLGSGYDWAAIAKVVTTEELSGHESEISFAPEGGLFAASGPGPVIKSLAEKMAALFHDDIKLNAVLSRAELD